MLPITTHANLDFRCVRVRGRGRGRACKQRTYATCFTHSFYSFNRIIFHITFFAFFLSFFLSFCLSFKKLSVNRLALKLVTITTYIVFNALEIIAPSYIGVIFKNHLVSQQTESPSSHFALRTWRGCVFSANTHTKLPQRILIATATSRHRIELVVHPESWRVHCVRVVADLVPFIFLG